MDQIAQSQTGPECRRRSDPPSASVLSSSQKAAEKRLQAERDQTRGADRPTRQTASDLAPHLPTLRRFACKLTRNAIDAEDLVQDSLERALRFGHQLRSAAALGSWLNMILYNTWITNCRRVSRRGDQFTADPDDIILSHPAEQEQGLLARDVLNAIDRLPAGQRDAVQLVAIGDLSYRDAAMALGVPVGTVMSRLSRARTDLRHSFAA